jgi:hypothetical protein
MWSYLGTGINTSTKAILDAGNLAYIPLHLVLMHISLTSYSLSYIDLVSKVYIYLLGVVLIQQANCTTFDTFKLFGVIAQNALA